MYLTISTLIPNMNLPSHVCKNTEWHHLYQYACMLSHSVMSDSLQLHGQWPTRLLCPGDFPTQGLNPSLLSPALTGRFFTTEPPGKNDWYKFICFSWHPRDLRLYLIYWLTLQLLSDTHCPCGLTKSLKWWSKPNLMAIPIKFNRKSWTAVTRTPSGNMLECKKEWALECLSIGHVSCFINERTLNYWQWHQKSEVSLNICVQTIMDNRPDLDYIPAIWNKTYWSFLPTPPHI